LSDGPDPAAMRGAGDEKPHYYEPTTERGGESEGESDESSGREPFWKRSELALMPPEGSHKRRASVYTVLILYRRAVSLAVARRATSPEAPSPAQYEPQPQPPAPKRKELQIVILTHCGNTTGVHRRSVVTRQQDSPWNNTLIQRHVPFQPMCPSSLCNRASCCAPGSPLRGSPHIS